MVTVKRRRISSKQHGAMFKEAVLGSCVAGFEVFTAVVTIPVLRYWTS